ncbi:hypothetical protein L202_01599 [Cryptococcus amylolentus CBS 6039]|uniref:AMMECR1 domain-containing protein n=1 Tax=Cryptococcus amylolentus CBS 6039 TaxID=1295533 RepID=A0A1E3I4I1_9TREE|nr:hypothetical protein L202_01599 [Cryptococcus amylolentus CBS 6039]ODN83462.1 hypothetical protein L202_01599 [Cryptococcus amylolentus CBS 6039]
MSLQTPQTPSLSNSATATPLAEGDRAATPVEEPICNELHPLWAFDVLVSHFEGREPVKAPFDNYRDEYALFVSWHVVKPGRKPALRGCIGSFSPMPLTKGVKDYSLISALRDHRFSPVRASELPTLSCDVSLLTPFTSISDPLDWVPGEHGIHLTFPHPTSPSKTYSATYLPQICPEQGWTKEETVLSAIHKSGYRGKVSVGDKVWQSLSVQVYGSVKVEVVWEEYVQWKEERGEAITVIKV